MGKSLYLPGSLSQRQSSSILPAIHPSPSGEQRGDGCRITVLLRRNQGRVGRGVMTTASKKHQMRPLFQKNRLSSWSRSQFSPHLSLGWSICPARVPLTTWCFVCGGSRRGAPSSEPEEAVGVCSTWSRPIRTAQGLPEPSSSPAVCHGLAEALGGDMPPCIWTHKCRG